jgi:hypothetical protein
MLRFHTRDFHSSLRAIVTRFIPTHLQEENSVLRKFRVCKIRLQGWRWSNNIFPQRWTYSLHWSPPLEVLESINKQTCCDFWFGFSKTNIAAAADILGSKETILNKLHAFQESKGTHFDGHCVLVHLRLHQRQHFFNLGIKHAIDFCYFDFKKMLLFTMDALFQNFNYQNASIVDYTKGINIGPLNMLQLLCF